MVDWDVQRATTNNEAWCVRSFACAIPSPGIHSRKSAFPCSWCFQSIPPGTSGEIRCGVHTLLPDCHKYGKSGATDWESQSIVKYAPCLHNVTALKVQNDQLDYSSLTYWLIWNCKEPGGYLQWFEPDMLTTKAIAINPKTSKSGTESMVAIMKKPNPDAEYK